MASSASNTILFGFVAVFTCLYLLEEATTLAQDLALQSPFAQIAAAAFLPAVVATFVLTQFLLILHIRSLGADAADVDAGRRFLRGLAKATLFAATATLLTGAVTCLVASGYLGGDDGVGWPHRKKTTDLKT